MDKFPEIAGQIQCSGASVGEDISSILIGDTHLLKGDVVFPQTVVVVVPPSVDIICIINGLRFDCLKAILRAVPLATLGKAAMAVSHKLVRTGPRDALNLEGKINMLEYTVMRIVIKVLY